ncbi:hypothetical protein GDO86_016327 [Hymenochirus boettgeri]|uniref:Regulator of microtubule dynamics protein 3 n=1 Tax=Hymenochirus boettgeri TaxID=247094 RepID=A0A8T2K0V5_9PIPI|nr:hypothetical protein GDO86_016327 [Hymenochirus boettgeri]
MSKLSYRIGLGLVAGATAGAVIFMVYRWNQKKNKKWTFKQNGHFSQPYNEYSALEMSKNLQVVSAEVSRGEQLDLLNRLDYVLNSIADLRQEVESLRSSLHGMAEDIVGEVSYSTANAESDFDRESSRASETEEEDEVSCETIRTMRRDSVDLVTDDESATFSADHIDEELTVLLQKSDQLHHGTAEQQREGFQLLLSSKLLYGECQEFLWRLARSYSDMCNNSEDTQEKKSYALDGKDEAEAALQKGDQNVESHKWFAILCGQLSKHEGIQKRIQTGYLFKDHIEKAIALKPDDARCYYLLGCWYYEVSNLGWLEKKTASALYETPPSATVHEALQHFLKAEDLTPGFSKAARVCIAKCYRDLGNSATAAHWLKLASELPDVTKEDLESTATIEEMLSNGQEENAQ